MISANSDDVYVEEATKSGERGYLLKQTCADSVLGDTGSRKREHLFSARRFPAVFTIGMGKANRLSRVV